MTDRKPDITFYYLGASRAIRIAWLLEELELPYKLVAAERNAASQAPPELKEQIPSKLKKLPVIKDGDIVIQESQAIVEYLCEYYDPTSRLIPKDVKQRARVQTWMAAAEGTFMMHAIAILYARWRIPAGAREYLEEMEAGLSINMQNDLNWLEAELEKSQTKFLVGNDVTAADIMMGFSLEFVYNMQLGTKGGSWPRVEAYLNNVLNYESYKRAIDKMGYKLKGRDQYK